MREPPFWWRQDGIEATLLAPVAAVYGAIAGCRLARPGWHAPVPVLCIGNPTAGGAGKTPTALALARMLATTGEQPAFLSRGYGGRLSGPIAVDPARHFAFDVGDEPLLLARVAPTVVARDRVAGAKAAIAAGASVLVMDDGFQNPSLHKNFSLLVIDSARGIGNGRVIPAGPLRAPLGAQLARADAVVMVGRTPPPSNVMAEASARRLPVFGAFLEPDAAALAAICAQPVLAFAGIGDPQKFFATLREAGVDVAARRSFDDHNRYTQAQAQDLLRQADRARLALVTTEKDLARLAGEDATAELARRALALPVRLRFDDEGAVRALTAERLAAARR